MIYFSNRQGELEAIIENEYKEAAEALAKLIIKDQMDLAYAECLKIAKGE